MTRRRLEPSNPPIFRPVNLYISLTAEMPLANCVVACLIQTRPRFLASRVIIHRDFDLAYDYVPLWRWPPLMHARPALRELFCFVENERWGGGGVAGAGREGAKVVRQILIDSWANVRKSKNGRVRILLIRERNWDLARIRFDQEKFKKKYSFD